MNITSPLKSENQLHTLKRGLTIILLGRLCNAPSNARTRKNIEAFFIVIMRPPLNEQIDCDALILFRNIVT